MNQSRSIHSPALNVQRGGALLRYLLTVSIAALTTGEVCAAADQPPSFRATATLKYPDLSGQNLSFDPTQIVHGLANAPMNPRIMLKAMQSAELQEACPWIKNLDFSDKLVQQDTLARFAGAVTCVDDPKAHILRISARQGDRLLAASLANACADATVQFVNDQEAAMDNSQVKTIQDRCDQLLIERAKLYRDRSELVINGNVANVGPELESAMKALQEITDQEEDARIQQATARISLQRQANDADEDPGSHRLAVHNLVEWEYSRDKILIGLFKEQIDADAALAADRNSGKTEDHPDILRDKKRNDRAIAAVNERTVQIRKRMDEKVAAQQYLQDKASAEKLSDMLRTSEEKIKFFDNQRTALEKKLLEAEKIQAQIDQIDNDIKLKGEDYQKTWEMLQALVRQQRPQFDTLLQISERASAANSAPDAKATIEGAVTP